MAYKSYNIQSSVLDYERPKQKDIGPDGSVPPLKVRMYNGKPQYINDNIGVIKFDESIIDANGRVAISDLLSLKAHIKLIGNPNLLSIREQYSTQQSTTQPTSTAPGATEYSEDIPF